MQQRRRLSAMISGYRASAAIGAAVQIGFLAPLKEAGTRLHSGELGQKIGIDTGITGRFCRILAAYGILDYGPDEKYELSQLGQMLLDPEDMFLAEADAMLVEYFPSFGLLGSALLSARPAFELANGQEFFSYLENNQVAAERHVHAMARLSATTSRELAANYDFSLHETIVDVGGGACVLADEVLRRFHPKKYIVFDLPHVVATVELCKNEAVAGALEVVSGNFFEGVPTGYELYILKWIIHDWDDSSSIRILENCLNCARPDGLVMIFDWIVPDTGGVGSPEVAADYTMMVFHRGFERTLDQFSELVHAAGGRIRSNNRLPSGRSYLLVERGSVAQIT